MTTSLEQAIHQARLRLNNPYAYMEELEELAQKRATKRKLEDPYAFADEADVAVAQFDGINVEDQLLIVPQSSDLSVEVRPKAVRLSRADVQRTAQDLLRKIWGNRATLFVDYEGRRPIDMLDPKVALEMLGYRVETVGALGQLAGSKYRTTNVAGLIDKHSRQVLLSSGLSPITRNFTLAHELGHALMHEFAGMHRDKPLGGASASPDPQEREADIFAACFLMPEKLIRAQFEQSFGQAPFVLDEETRFALAGSLPKTDWQPRNLRDLARLLSRASRFNGLNLFPLNEQFRVSAGAMTIRLEELQLLSPFRT
ncbi:hypothetical protein C7T35_10995 [Variovorax sp. WS11]|uniref:ImmA/IrrE family metallo-endopeptidase n=1 Tax=Variovorax sp. WS11 TaxID=1105204 RepID=UPI000D0D04F5|nr:ImmA/IrrE family metallo-endopeptidase [Variovorax sp. WS11]NDZ12278.1 ImmA/IrrE family metallo-endopeptidase [Variovorax sp. WS11]PSL84539.1 hypothetical protein C7T35_10995 [Variovorax sp. WS11]